MITGLRPESFTKLQLNAGAFLKGFNHATASDADALATAVLAFLEAGTGVIGATSGGGSFEAVPTMREIELDGKRAPIKGSTVVDMWNVKLKGTMKEITPENFASALVCAQATTAGTKTTLKIKAGIGENDYIPSLCWVGDLSSGGMILIDLKNALNLVGATFTFTDKGEGSLPFEFQACQASLSDGDYAPCEIIFFDKPAV